MKAATVKQLKDQLNEQTPANVVALCLRLAKFKKENKELLTYLLFDTEDEAGYVRDIKEEVDTAFAEINTYSFYYIKKSVRKILRSIKKYSRYSNEKETEVELLLYFLHKMRELRPSIYRNVTLTNIYDRQRALLLRKIDGLHEDLQYDYREELRSMEEI